MMNKKLGILLSTPPDNKNFETVIGLINASRKTHVNVYLYLIDDGVRCIQDKRLIALSGNGLKFYVCAYGAQMRGVEPVEIAAFSGLAVLSEIIGACDQFVSFG